jgi:hypothetical protein
MDLKLTPWLRWHKFYAAEACAGTKLTVLPIKVQVYEMEAQETRQE